MGEVLEEGLLLPGLLHELVPLGALHLEVAPGRGQADDGVDDAAQQADVEDDHPGRKVPGLADLERQDLGRLGGDAGWREGEAVAAGAQRREGDHVAGDDALSVLPAAVQVVGEAPGNLVVVVEVREGDFQVVAVAGEPEAAVSQVPALDPVGPVDRDPGDVDVRGGGLVALQEVRDPDLVHGARRAEQQAALYGVVGDADIVAPGAQAPDVQTVLAD